ncbi:integrase [Herbaspirillum seropedicae]|uniref:Mu transposase C-terminal domain-containing protein n=1 Tax=Herbaspirillum seropedicae TaxID=964 RepID=UPI001120F047|nr:Mu transposase C-terminal domain-containing protein [Herbaspirillum seropedicae]QDD62692.1 integrase [Herbaspirillum seropedicae]
MANFSIRVGATFDLDEVPTRISALHGTEQVLLQNMDTGEVELHVRRTLLDAFREGRIAATENGIEPLKNMEWDRPLEDLTTEVKKELLRRKHYVNAVYSGNQVFKVSELKVAILDAASEIIDENPPSVSSVRRWISRYRASGNSIRSLIPRKDQRGSRKFKQSPRMLELIRDSIEEAYQRTPAATIKTMETLLAAKISRANSFLDETEQLKIPSRRTLFRFLHRVEVHDRVRMREGKVTADRKLRVTRAVTPVKDILERIEMDHTPLDLFLIDDRTWLPLGRPTLTVALDCYSRMILGYYLSYGGTSAAAVLATLRHAILPKESAVPVIPSLSVNNTWPCYGLMDCLVLDNGLEFLGTDLERVALDFGISLQLCPTRVPQFKGRVERVLKTINYSFAHQLPGTSMARMEKRGDYDPQKHALLTLSEFKHVFEKWLLDDYGQTIHRGIGTTPYAKWLEGMRRRQPMLPPSNAVLRKRIGKSLDRSLRHDGLWLFGIRYSSDLLTTILRVHGRGVRVRVVYDPEDMEAVEVWPPHEQESITVPAVDVEYARGLTLYQHQCLAEILRERGQSAENPLALMNARIELAESIEDLMKSRKQRNRKLAARLNGKTSSHPDREFNSEKTSTKRHPEKLSTTASDDAPQGKYSLIHSVERKRLGQ